MATSSVEGRLTIAEQRVQAKEAPPQRDFLTALQSATVRPPVGQPTPAPENAVEAPSEPAKLVQNIPISRYESVDLQARIKQADDYLQSFYTNTPPPSQTKRFRSLDEDGDNDMSARGLRNNNPGNIRLSSQQWQGQVAGKDAEFVTFETPEAGIRAMGRVLTTYSTKHKLNTVGGIISRWAPPNENDTESYVNSVARQIGVDPKQPLDLTNRKVMSALIKAIVRHENGSQPYSDRQIDQAMTMLGLAPASE